MPYRRALAMMGLRVSALLPGEQRHPGSTRRGAVDFNSPFFKKEAHAQSSTTIYHTSNSIKVMDS